MNVGELRSLLKDFDDDAEVRLAHQPSWPFEYAISDVVEVDPSDEGDDEDEDAEEADGDADEKPAIVYIAEGSQLGYLPDAATRQLAAR